ncbi:MAG TPA: hypothetical protein VLC30_08315, partial [Pseudomonas sp.]|nr:hypothetical protein [Pseudomonas sp.]
DPALRDQPGLYPDRDTKRRLAALDTLPDKLSDTRDQVWDEFRVGSIAAHQLVEKTQ